MRDPVILPSSRAVVASHTIKSHLLSDTKDPFNRSPLNIEDVIPGKLPLSELSFFPPFILDSREDTALKVRIDAFLEEKRSKKSISTRDMDVS